MKKYFPSSELIINEDGSVFHLHVKPEWLAQLFRQPGSNVTFETGQFRASTRVSRAR